MTPRTLTLTVLLRVLMRPYHFFEEHFDKIMATALYTAMTGLFVTTAYLNVVVIGEIVTKGEYNAGVLLLHIMLDVIWFWAILLFLPDRITDRLFGRITG